MSEKNNIKMTKKKGANKDEKLKNKWSQKKAQTKIK